MSSVKSTKKVVKKLASPDKYTTAGGNSQKIIVTESAVSKTSYSYPTSRVYTSYMPPAQSVVPVAATSQVYSTPLPPNQAIVASSSQVTRVTSPLRPPVNMKEEGHKIDEFNMRYVGYIGDDKFNGMGIVYDDKNNEVYRGEWKDGARSGNGLYKYPDESFYDGEWKENMKHGTGKFVSKAGEYSGQWQNNKRHGKGSLKIYSSNIRMEGKWVNDEFVGGQVMYPDGSIYEGPMNQFYRQGQGNYQYLQKSQYAGKWWKNNKEGKGTIYHSNDDKFEGFFRNNLRDGDNCRYLWKDGRYEIRDAYYLQGNLKYGKLYENGGLIKDVQSVLGPAGSAK